MNERAQRVSSVLEQPVYGLHIYIRVYEDILKFLAPHTEISVCGQSEILSSTYREYEDTLKC